MGLELYGGFVRKDGVHEEVAVFVLLRPSSSLHPVLLSNELAVYSTTETPSMSPLASCCSAVQKMVVVSLKQLLEFCDRRFVVSLHLCLKDVLDLFGYFRPSPQTFLPGD